MPSWSHRQLADLRNFHNCERRHARALQRSRCRGAAVDHDQWRASSGHEQGRRTAWVSASSRVTGVCASTHQPIGGVAPVGHPKPIPTIVDRALAEFDELWAAGGIPNAVFPLTYDELLR